MTEPENQLGVFLSGVPITGTYQGRSLLLDGVAGRTGFRRSEEVQLLDLQYIVQHIRTDRDALRRLIANAKPYLQSHEIEELERLVEAVRIPPQVPALELGALHRFDLHLLLEVCRPRIRKTKGLIGFTVDSPCDRLIDHLAERLKDEISTLGPVLPRVVNSVSGLRSVQSAVTQIRGFKPLVRVHSVVCKVVVADGALAAKLWEAATAELAADCPNRFVFLVLIKEGFATPPGMVELPRPSFQQHHAVDWWREVIEVRRWQSARLHDLLHGFEQGLDSEGGLDMDVVYDTLAEALEMLKRYPEEDRFHAAWAKRLQGAI
jgi:hypothetical protein